MDDIQIDTKPVDKVTTSFPRRCQFRKDGQKLIQKPPYAQSCITHPFYGSRTFRHRNFCAATFVAGGFTSPIT